MRSNSDSGVCVANLSLLLLPSCFVLWLTQVCDISCGVLSCLALTPPPPPPPTPPPPPRTGC
jgi:hypothetical protein